MDEVKRFMRYTIPGMSSVLLLLFMLAMTDFPYLLEILKNIGGENSIGTVFALFLGSGALGFIFANMFIFLCWTPPFSRWIALNHKSILGEIKDKVNIRRVGGGKVRVEDLSRREAWQIVVRLWWTNTGENGYFNRINVFTERVSDIAHSLGALIIGSVCALMAWSLLHYKIIQNDQSNIMGKPYCLFASWTILFIMYLFNYIRTVRTHEMVVNTSILSFLESANGEKKLTIHLSK